MQVNTKEILLNHPSKGLAQCALHCHLQPPEPRVLVLCLCHVDASALILSPIQD